MGPSGVGFRRFWLATSVSVLGTWMAAIALSIRMYDVTGSPGWVSALLFAEFVPSVVIGLLAGNRLNRLRVRRAMVLCDLGSAVVFALLAMIETPWAVVALAGTAGIAVGVFRPLATSAVPLLVSDDELEPATGAIASADNAMTLLGAVLGGLLVGGVGADLALALNAASFVV
jgi:MFS family permease